MLCKKCHPVMGHRLIQTGAADPKSYKCCVCDTIHDDNGELFDPDNQSRPTCPFCGSVNIERLIAIGKKWCRDCCNWILL